jgi:mRNA interferase RelE/StbE
MLSRVKEAVLALGDNPRPSGSRKLVNVSPETWRVRVGDWRMIYRLNDGDEIVTVVGVVHRREAYRKR